MRKPKVAFGVWPVVLMQGMDAAMKGSILTLLPLFTLALVACSASSDDAGRDEAFETVHPVGTDIPGRILVKLPPGFPPGSVDELKIDGSRRVPGEVVGGLRVGSHTIQVNGIEETIEVTANGTFVYELGAVELKMPSEPVLGLNAPGEDGKPTGRVYFTPRSDTGRGASNLAPGDSATRVLPPGAMTASWGPLDGQYFEVQPGQKTVLDLGATAGRRLGRIHAPARAFPNAAGANAFWRIRVRGGGETKTLVPSRTTILVGAQATSASSLFLSLPYARLDQLIELSPDGASPAEQTVGRIDVDDVAVTMADGQVEMVQGSFTISNNLLEYTASTTRHGVDVWPGTYAVSTSYKTASHGTRQDRQTITIADH